MAKTLEELLKENEAVLIKLNNAGIKSIQTAIDYLQIYLAYESLNYMNSKTDRKNRVAENLGLSKRTVDIAVNACRKEL